MVGTGCRRHRAAPGAPPARESRGFDPSLSAPPRPPTEAEQEKMRRRNADPQPHFPARRVPAAHAVDLYVDESLRRTLQTAELAKQPQPLASLVPAAPVRSLLAHGASGEVWIRSGELANYELKVNRRGEVKLQDRSVGDAHGGRRSHGGGKNPGTPSVPRKVRRAHEVSGLQWIEVRTPKSARLRDEP